jgi:hypothetical protein
MTIPESTFAEGSPAAIPCIFKITTEFCFSQRRVDINDLVTSMISTRVKSKTKEMAKKLMLKSETVKDEVFSDFSD